MSLEVLSSRVRAPALAVSTPVVPALSSATRPVVPLWAALLLAAASGPIMDAGFPDRGWWPLTFVGVAVLLVTLIGRKVKASLLLGLVGGLAFYFIHIEWAALFLGIVPMAALAILESLFYAGGAVAIALAYRWLPRAFPTAAGRLVLLPAAVAGLWTAREAWASVWPYGGFAWGRVSLSQSESPFAGLFSWLGVSGVSFVMVLIVALAIEIVRLHRVAGHVRGAAVVVAAITLALVVPAFPVAISGTMSVAAVQGNGKAGYFDTREYGDLLQSQVSATLPLIDQDLDLDVVIWPEGGSDRDPLKDAGAASQFDYLTRELDAPLVSGAITERGDKIFNSSLLWHDGEATDIYDKRHPVPFGEYVPDRDFWTPFAPDLLAMIGRDYTPGTTDAVFDIDGIIAGINICFDIVDDQLMHDTVTDGAQVIFAQSNNADFGLNINDYTDEGVQQLAIARIRALELGRSVVNISTVGTSAIITPDGATLDQLPVYTAAIMTDDVPLSSTITASVVVGRQIEWFVSGLGLAALIIAGLGIRTPRVRRRS